MKTRLPRLICLSLLACLATAAPAAAQAETEMIGTENFSHVKNLQYEKRYETEANGGSDIEFAELTLPGAAAPATPATPARPVAAKKKAKSAKKRYRACVKKAKRKKGAARKRAMKKCKKQLRKRTKARRSSLDVNAARPGVQRTFAFAGTYYNGLQIVDVSDPENARIVNNYDCGLAQGDVQVFTRPDKPGRTFVAYAADDPYAFQPESACATEAAKAGFADAEGGSGTFIIDVTDPTAPRTVSYVFFEKGSHNQTVHPSGMYLYNSNSDTVTTIEPSIEVADITDLEKPKQIATIPLEYRPGLGSESHDIWFNADGTRAYSAAVSQGVVIDTSNPREPKVISSIFDPAVNVWHQAETVEVETPAGKRTLLIGADEFAGATPTAQCPNGGLHIYDVSPDVEAAPLKVGYWNFDEVRPTDDQMGCTAHVFQVFRDQGIMLIANYNGGVHVLDLGGLVGLGAGSASTGITELGRARFSDSNTWAVKAPRFDRKGVSYMYANDQNRGLDVFRFDGTK